LDETIKAAAACCVGLASFKRRGPENSLISAEEFRKQLLQGTALPNVPAKEDLGQEHPDLIK
jgi:hypothetical protein